MFAGTRTVKRTPQVAKFMCGQIGRAAEHTVKIRLGDAIRTLGAENAATAAAAVAANARPADVGGLANDRAVQIHAREQMGQISLDSALIVGPFGDELAQSPVTAGRRVRIGVGSTDDDGRDLVRDGHFGFVLNVHRVDHGVNPRFDRCNAAVVVEVLYVRVAGQLRNAQRGPRAAAASDFGRFVSALSELLGVTGAGGTCGDDIILVVKQR